jgi:hypothetical protein
MLADVLTGLDAESDQPPPMAGDDGQAQVRLICGECFGQRARTQRRA